METDKVEVEEELSSSGSDSDEVPELEQHEGGAMHEGDDAVEGGSRAKQSRGEKKARKAMAKLGLKPVRIFFIFIISLLCFGVCL